MIHLTDITKQYGPRILYRESSFQIRTGDRIGLVGPNGAGKTTIFRIITGEEKVDSGSISISEKAIVGYFSQNIGEMRGNSALEEVKAGAGRISFLAKKLARSAMVTVAFPPIPIFCNSSRIARSESRSSPQ